MKPGERATPFPGARAGDEERLESVLRLLYDELRANASAQLARERDAMADATSLVHEAVLRISELDGDGVHRPRAYLFAAAACAMRRILIERARRRAAPKHGGDHERVPLADAERWDESVDVASLLALDEALERLEQADPRKAHVVVLRFYGGLTNEQTADALDLSIGTVKNDWRFARAWLRSAISGEDDHAGA